jgi:PhnB protein
MSDPEFAQIEVALAECPHDGFYERLRGELQRRIQMISTVSGLREGFSTVTPYLGVVDVERLVQFAKKAFGAVETGRSMGDSGHPHVELRIGDSMLMCGGGEAVRGHEKPLALHLYVPDADEAYRQALAAGAESLGAPEDRPYGERQGGVKDPTGNLWYMATRLPGTKALEGMRAVTPYMHHENALGLIEFLKQAFSARELGVYKAPDGRIMHAALRIGDSIVEMGETTPMPASFYLYVPDSDAVHAQAVSSGAKSLLVPTDQAYGDRMGVVEDAWGNIWCIATHPRPGSV